MKKLYYLAALALTASMAAGCGAKKAADTSVTTGTTTAAATATQASEYDAYTGDWKLSVPSEGELYLLSALDTYLGSTGISIEIDGNRAKGCVYSVSGAPSLRQANVDFEGDIKDGKLMSDYKDEGWEYSGKLELKFDDGAISANITREKSGTASLWGIPEGRFEFVRPINTQEIVMTEEEKKSLEKLLFPMTKEKIKPFKENELTDKVIIDFVGINVALGDIDISNYGDKVKDGIEVQFDESVMNGIAEKYFGRSVETHQPTDFVKYEKGTYTVPALGGVWEYPTPQMLMQDMENEGVYYAIADYMSQAPDEDKPKLEYQYLFKLKKADGFTVKSITNISSPIDFELLRQN